MFAPDGRVLGYYNASAFSYGLHAGSKGFLPSDVFMNDNALNDLKRKLSVVSYNGRELAGRR